MAESKGSKVAHWAAHHTAWELTGSGVVGFVKDEVRSYIRPYLGGSVISGGISYVLSRSGLGSAWMIALTLVVFGIVMLLWDIAAKRKSVPNTSPLDPLSNASSSNTDGDILKNAPRLVVKYSRDQDETLTFKNEKDASASNLTVGPVMSTNRHSMITVDLPPKSVHSSIRQLSAIESPV